MAPRRITAAILAAAVITGCGSSDEPSLDAAPVSDESTTAPSAAAEETEPDDSQDADPPEDSASSDDTDAPEVPATAASIAIAGEAYGFEPIVCDLDPSASFDNIEGVIDFDGRPAYISVETDNDGGAISMRVGIDYNPIALGEPFAETTENGLTAQWIMFYDEAGIEDFSDTTLNASGEVDLNISQGDDIPTEPTPFTIQADCS